MLWLILSALIVVLDRVTKLVIAGNLELYEVIPVIDSFFNITFIKNDGAAWGVMSGNRVLLIGMSVVVAGLLFFFFFKIKSMFFKASAALIIAGAIGNLIDRVLTGQVVDFLQFYIFGYRFPSFNIADIAVVIGSFMLGVYILFFYEKDKNSGGKKVSADE